MHEIEDEHVERPRPVPASAIDADADMGEETRLQGVDDALAANNIDAEEEEHVGTVLDERAALVQMLDERQDAGGAQ